MFKICFSDIEASTVVTSYGEAVEMLCKEWEAGYNGYADLLNPAPYRAEALQIVSARASALGWDNEWLGARFEGLLEPLEAPNWRKMRELRKDRWTVFTGAGSHQQRWPDVTTRAGEAGLRSGIKCREVSL